MKSITKTKSTTYEFTQVGLDMMMFDKSYQRIRQNFKYQGFGCFVCGKYFEAGEKISLVMIKDHENRVVCHNCALEIKDDLRD